LLHGFKISPFLFVFALCILSVLSSTTANAQDIFSDDSTKQEIADQDSLRQEIAVTDSENVSLPENNQSDSLVIKRGKVKEEKEPVDTLSTYFFDDTLYYNKIIVWNVDRYFNTPRMKTTDTLQSQNITDLPFYREDVGVTYLGVTGSASQLHNFFKWEKSEVFPFMNPYNLYTHSPDNVNFYNTKGPYTNLSYYTSGNKRIGEDNIKALFTRNVSPALNLSLFYQKMGAKGIYQNQRTKDKNFNLLASYVGKRYVAHAGYIHNGINNKENGGIVNDFYIVDTIINSEAIDVKLKSALNRVSSNTYFLTHSYGLPLNIFKRDSADLENGTMVFFGHSFEYSRYRRVYSDGPSDVEYVDLHGNPGVRQNYYENYYLNSSRSYDSTFSSKFDNKAFIRLQPYSSTAIISNIDGGIGYSFDKYYGFKEHSYLYKQSDYNPSTGYIYGNTQGMFSKYFSWNAFLKYNFSGYRMNDLYFDATANLSTYPTQEGVHFNGRLVLDNKEQPYFIQNYFSNHFKWNNNFDKTTETRIEASVSIPDLNLEAGFKNGIISKYVYFDDNALPKQTSEVLNVTSIYLNSKLSWWILRLDTRLLFQSTSNSSVLPLPAFSGNMAFYQESEWVKNVLNSRIGFDVYYNTNFYDYAYNPAVGMFHTQSEKQIGNYPWVDLFATFKWKRANVFVKFTNVAEGIIGERNYFSALHYPRNKRMLRLGVSWYFHN